jgi:fused signal recognition particle receptor
MRYGVSARTRLVPSAARLAAPGWYNPPVDTRGWREALARTRQATLGRLERLLGASQLAPGYWDQLEEALLAADLGPATTQDLLDRARRASSTDGLRSGSDVRQWLRQELLGRLGEPSLPEQEDRPMVVVLAGVNGSGKTTAAARLARLWQREGHSILLAAADTYRAAAGEQLEVWGQRLGVDVISGQPGGDPGAVVYDAIQAALSRKIDVLIVDTSGRMHTHHNLMEELQKVCRVCGKLIPGAPHQVLLVMDATTGQNGLSQARAFTEAVGVTGVVLAKLDGSARGGVGLAIQSDLGLPIRYVGLGEGLDDLQPFDRQAYVDGLLAQEAA